MRLDAGSFLVKASGHQMHGIGADGFVAVRLEPILALLDDPPASLSEQKAITNAAVLDRTPTRSPPKHQGGRQPASPSIEVSFHAMLLQECGARVIGHTHPTAINQIMCSAFAADFARHRRFPDEAVVCGPVSCLAPYADPGLPLALVMREAVRAFMADYDEAPKLILLENHGMIALGDTPAEILNITAMAVKAARIYLGAQMTGEPTRLPDDEAWHIARRPDEIYRRKLFVNDSD